MKKTSHRWIAIAFLLVAILRLVMHVRRQALIFFLLLIVPSVLADTTSYVTIHNTGQGTIHQLTGITVYCDTSTGQSHANDAGYWNFYSPLTTGLGDYAWILASDEYDSITLSCNNYDSGSGNTENFTVVMGDGVGDTWTSSTSPMIHGGQNADLYIAIGPPAPVYTNYTFTANNNDATRSEKVVFNFDGVVQQTSLVPPMGSVTYTTPPIEISPTNENWTFSDNGTFINDTTITNGINNDGMPTLTFTNTTEDGGGTTSGGSGSSPPTGTNTFSAGGGGTLQQAPTNIVLFPASTGSTNGQGANNADMEAGFQLLHKDLRDVVTGESVINTTIQSGMFTLTNELGQIVHYEYLQSNDAYIVTSAITNLAHELPTNASSGVSNVWVQNWPSNLNAIGSNVWVQNFPTNQATESTLEGVTNLLGQLVGDADTNFPDTNGGITVFGYTNYDDAAAAAATQMAGSDSAFATFVSSISGFAQDDIHDTMYDMTYHFPYSYADWSIDFNPLDDSRMATIFQWVKQITTWLLAIMYMRRCANDSFEVLKLMNSAHGYAAQNQVAMSYGLSSVTVEGSILVVIKWLKDVAVLLWKAAVAKFVQAALTTTVQAAVLLAWAALLAAFYTGLSGLGIQTAFNTNPFTGIPADIMTMVCACFPLHFAIGLVFAYINFKFTVGHAALIMSRAVKLLPGG